MGAATTRPFVYPHIAKEPGMCGGQPCIDGTRVRVKNIVALQMEGFTPEQMLTQYPGLSLAQIHAALVYYYDNREEIDSDLAEGQRAAADFERERAEFLALHPLK